MPKYSLITSFLGETKDRFHTYNRSLPLDEKLRLVKKIPHYSGVELVYPYEVGPAAGLAADQTTELLERHGLACSAVNVNVKGEPEFVAGGLTSSDPKIRARAVSFIKDAKDFAAEIGAPRVTCCPLGDGHEYVFQSDYDAAWGYLQEAFSEAAEYRREMPLMIEYKPKETRRHCYLDRAATTLLLVTQIGVDTLGVTMDFGHSVYAEEHPADALTLLHRSGYPYYIHINDNDKTWDWDFFTGSHSLLEYIEFVYYLRRYGYADYLTSDTHPTRWDMSGMFAINARMTEKIWNLIESIGDNEIERRIADDDYIKTWQFIETKILHLE